MRIINLIMFVYVLGIYGFAQTNVDTFSKVPSTEVMPVVVMQPNSPLLVESFILGRNSYGKDQSFYQIKNRSSKPIKFYSVARWYSDNTGFVGGGEMPDSGIFRPGETTTNFHGTWKSEMDVRDTTNLQKIAFILVLEVVFSDGTRFDATPEFTALEAHLKLFEARYNTHGKSQ